MITQGIRIDIQLRDQRKPLRRIQGSITVMDGTADCFLSLQIGSEDFEGKDAEDLIAGIEDYGILMPAAEKKEFVEVIESLKEFNRKVRG